ncbi:endonuclease MutS2 [bacterium]|nr:endonuclease MutS2 [bacterium]
MIVNREINSVQVLELDTILKKISEFAISAVGKERIENISPYSEFPELEKELVRINEMTAIFNSSDIFPLQSFPDIGLQMKQVEPEGAFLEPKELIVLKCFLAMIREMVTFFSHKREVYPLLWLIGKGLISLHSLEKEIDRIIDSSGEVKDHASKALFKIRQEIQHKSLNVRRRLKTILNAMTSKGYTSENDLMLRDGRLVIPMKETQSHRLKGLVVDQSASGATLFVEPLEVLELNHDLSRLRVQEKKEIERILKMLCDRIREYRTDIENDFSIAVELDCLMAKAKFSLHMHCKAAQINRGGHLELKQARHPILLLRENQEQVVPLSIQLGGNLKTLVITGPNAGGKTVTLKTVGLLSLMHQCGLHVPAEEGTSIPLFSHIFADIGDRQSIEQDLSTFSSHIMNIHHILKKTDQNSLVLLDEIGSATDPSEGASLASAILKNLTEKNCLTIATTHIGILKVFAHEETGMGNGSMVFDQKTLQPTYQFQMGVPGSSYAFEIAERLGLPSQMIQDARKRVGEERGKLDRLILHLEEELQRVRRLLGEAEIKESKLSALVKLYQEQIHSIEKESEVRKNEILKEAEAILKDANVIVEKTVREIRESQAQRETILEAKNKLKNHRKKIKDLVSQKSDKQIDQIIQGDWVVWKGHKGAGKVISEADKSGRISVQWGNVKLRVQMRDLKLIDRPDEKRSLTGMTTYSIERETKQEIDLRGMRVDEVVAAVEKYLEDATMGGFSQIRIIHGKGTGALRKEVNRLLKNHRLVKHHRLGNWNEGDTGVTIVELK